MIISDIPDNIDPNEDWLLQYYAGAIGVSKSRLRRAVEAVGQSSRKVRKHIGEGYRVAVEGEDGRERLIARIGFLRDGFHLSVPYHPVTDGLVLRIPYDYSQKQSIQKLHESATFTVSDRVKLSLHMGGFVQFSSSGRPIVSGYNRELEQIRGVGLKAPTSVNVTSGPLCGLIFQGLDKFVERGGKHAETFRPGDLWHHPLYAGLPTSTAYNLEFFMFPVSELVSATTTNGNYILRRELPFQGEFSFRFDLRIMEVPHMPFFLGVILSRFEADPDFESGYKLGGPGCFDTDGNAFGIAAWYPRPLLEGMNLQSLDYDPNDEAE